MSATHLANLGLSGFFVYEQWEKIDSDIQKVPNWDQTT